MKFLLDNKKKKHTYTHKYTNGLIQHLKRHRHGAMIIVARRHNLNLFCRLVVNDRKYLMYTLMNSWRALPLVIHGLIRPEDHRTKNRNDCLQFRSIKCHVMIEVE